MCVSLPLRVCVRPGVAGLVCADFGVERSVDTSSLQAADVEKSFLALISHANNLPRSDESKDSKKIA